MEICKKIKFVKNLIFLLSTIFLTNFSYATTNFETLEKKTTSYLDFLLLKMENKLIQRAATLGPQAYATRVQYSSVGVEIEYDQNKNQILIDIHAIMDKRRYTKKRYKQKLSDCNVVRNLIFYRKMGYSFFRQKRISTYLSEDVMVKIFKEVFLSNLSLDEKEENFLLDNMFVRVNVINPANRTELTCKGKVNDYELR